MFINQSDKELGRDTPSFSSDRNSPNSIESQEIAHSEVKAKGAQLDSSPENKPKKAKHVIAKEDAHFSQFSDLKEEHFDEVK